jgi:ribonuclease HI
MLEKIPGTPRIDKLRVIQLFEADFNLTLGIFWGRKLVKQSEQYKALGNEQWGSRPGRQALDPAMLKELTYEVATTTRQNIATFDNDAKACYDRIIMSLAAIRAKQLGLHQETINTLINFLKIAEYHVTTGHGTSSEYYSDSKDMTLHGPGQGSRAGPAIWLIISTALLAAYKQNATALTLSNPDGTIVVSRHADCFVDDTTTFCNTNPDALKAELQANAQQWESILYSSGGALELPKCFYYIMDWSFDENGQPYLKEPTPLPLTIINSATKSRQIILEKSTSESHRTLGVRLAPNGKWHDEIKYLQEKADKIAHRILKANCTRNDASILERCVYRPSLTYSLEVTNLSQKDCDKIQSKAISHILAKAGYNRNMPRSVVFGPSSLGGIGFTNLYTEQGVSHIHSYIRHTRANDAIGKLMHISLDYLQLTAGVGRHILQQPSEHNFSYTGAQWMCCLHQFLYENNLAITTPRAYKPTERRVNDKLLIDVALEHFNKSELVAINQCRLYLRVETISDISTANGLKLQHIIRKAQRPNSHSLLLWPQQPKPSTKLWTIWRQLLQHIADDANNLYTPLGPWTNLAHRRWDYQYCPSENNIKTPTGYLTIVTRSRTKWSTTISEPTHQEHWVPIDVLPRCLTQFSPPATSNITQNTAQTWQQMFNNDINHTTSHALTPTLIGVSDGGHDPHSNRASYGWSVESTTKHNIAEGAGRVQGSPLSSFRAEAYGLLALMRYINQIPTSHAIKLYTDSKSVIQRCKRPISYSPHSTILPDADVINTIKDEIKSSMHTIEIEHVKGHQDKKKPLDKLPQPAQMNVRADELATKAMNKPQQQFTYLKYDTYLMHNNAHITKSEKTIIRIIAHENELKAKLLAKIKPPFEVDWAILKAARSQTPHLHQFTTKLIYDWLPTFKYLARQNTAHPCKCPFCPVIAETTMHAFQCVGNSFIPKLKQKLERFIDEKVPRQYQATIIGTINNHLEPILKGLLPKNWKENKEKQWKTQLVRLTWEAAHEHWGERCKKVLELPSEQLQVQIQELYNQKDTLTDNDQEHIYQEQLETILQAPRATQTNWLKSYSNIISSIKRSTAAAMTQVSEAVQNIISPAGVQNVDSNLNLER